MHVHVLLTLPYLAVIIAYIIIKYNIDTHEYTYGKDRKMYLLCGERFIRKTWFYLPICLGYGFHVYNNITVYNMGGNTYL